MVSYCTIWYHIIQYGIILFNMVYSPPPQPLSSPDPSPQPPASQLPSPRPTLAQPPNHIVQYGIILYNMASYCTIWYHIVQYGIILYNISVKLPYLDTLEVSGGVNTTKLKPRSSPVDLHRPPGPPGPKMDTKIKN